MSETIFDSNFNNEQHPMHHGLLPAYKELTLAKGLNHEQRTHAINIAEAMTERFNTSPDDICIMTAQLEKTVPEIFVVYIGEGIAEYPWKYDHDERDPELEITVDGFPYDTRKMTAVIFQEMCANLALINGLNSVSKKSTWLTGEKTSKNRSFAPTAKVDRESGAITYAQQPKASGHGRFAFRPVAVIS